MKTEIENLKIQVNTNTNNLYSTEMKVNLITPSALTVEFGRFDNITN